jgi:polygalacturonase
MKEIHIESDNPAGFAAALSDLRASGGGTLRVGPGVWKTGPIELYSNMTLFLEEGAVLSFIPDPWLYRPVWSRWEGLECWCMHPLIYAAGQSGVKVCGKGVIDGSGQAWWARLRERREKGETGPVSPEDVQMARLNEGIGHSPGVGGGGGFHSLRPPLVQFYKCSDVTIEGVTLQNSPFWTLHPVYCTGLKILNIRVINPVDGPNTDAMDIDSCSDVLVEGCNLSVGDDGVTIKSGSGPDGVRVGRPTRNVTVRRCTVNDGHGGVVIGSETAGGISDVFVEDCVFKGTDRGIRIKTRRGRGGTVEGLHFKNIVMEDTLCPITVNMYYRCGGEKQPELFDLDSRPVDATTPCIRNITIEGVKAGGCRSSAGFIAGLPESPIRGLVIRNCDFSTNEADPASPDKSEMYLGLPSVQGKGLRIRNAEAPVFENLTINGPAEPFVYN